MANLGSIAALKTKCASVISEKTPPNKIEPDAHYKMLVDLIDTLSALTSVTKNTIDKDFDSGYNAVVHGLGTQIFMYKVLWYDIAKGAYVELNVKETNRSDTTVTIYLGEEKIGCKVIFL